VARAPPARSASPGLDHGAELLRQQLPRPGQPPRRDPGRHAGPGRTVSASPRCASSAAPRIHKQLEAAPQPLPRHRRHHPLRLLLRRQRRPLRDPARPRRRDHLRRPQPRLDHRRRPPLQGRAPPLPQQRHGRPRAHLKQTQRCRLRLIATDGVFSMDGYIANLPHLRPRRQIRRHGHGRRLPRHRLRRPHRPRHPRALRRPRPRRHHHLHPRQGPRRRLRRLHRRPPEIVELLRQRSRPYLFSNTVPPPSSPPPSPSSTSSKTAAPSAADKLRRNNPALPRAA
jgi:hypothetical protein